MAYGQLEPFGEDRADLRAAIIAATVANANRDPKRQRRPFRVEDFMPRFGEEPLRQDTWQSQLAMVEMLNVAYRGRDARGRRT